MNIAVIFAGGVGSRMNSKAKPKQFLNMHGKPIIIHTLEKFEEHPKIDAVVVACIQEWIPYLKQLIKKYNLEKVVDVVPGGVNSQESIYFGLCAAKKASGQEKSIVLIHDGVRPLIDEKVISNSISSVELHDSAIACVKVKETVLLVDDANGICEIPNREDSRLARAPQSFWLDEILDAHQKARETNLLDFIDCCSMMQYYGKKLYLIDSPEENIKITTPEDFYIMRAMLDAKEDSQIYGMEEQTGET